MEFLCTGVGVDIIYFINDTFATYPNIIAKGFIQQIGVDILDVHVIRNLTLKSAKLTLNNTDISCRLELVNGTYDTSSSSTLLIQGK